MAPDEPQGPPVGGARRPGGAGAAWRGASTPDRPTGDWARTNRPTGRARVLAALVAVALRAAACGSSKSDDASSTDGTAGAGGAINLVAYSTPQAAYTAIESAFQDT